MTEIEFQFDNMDEFDDVGVFDVESEIIPSTEVLDMKLKGDVPEVDELNVDINRRSGGFPDQFGVNTDDIDGFYDE
jgi:hypothetical protein